MVVVPYTQRPHDRPQIIRVTPPERRLVLLHRPRLLRQGGVGGWQERRHDRSKATTEWVGTPLHTMTLQLLFDSLRSPSRDDVEDELAVLHTFGLPTGTTGEPPVLRLNFGHGQQLQWVIDDERHVAVENDPASGRRVQATVDLDLREYRQGPLALSPVEQVEQDAAPDVTPFTRGTGGEPRTYTVRPGDSLTRIAHVELDDASRFEEIYQMNTPDPMSRGRDYLQVGWVLRLPAA